jgi:hypothetical protein
MPRSSDHRNGVRFWAGSINHLRLVQNGDFTATVRPGESWATNVRFTHDETLGRSEDAFNLTEATWQLGVYGIHRLSRRFTAEAASTSRTAAATSIRRYGWTSGDSSPRAPRATSTSTYS